MSLFAASLSGLAVDEVRKAKLLYIRNAISEREALVASTTAFKSASGCFKFFPFFWPIVGMQNTVIDAQIKLSRDQITNAIDVWRDDLKGERFEIDGQVIQL